MLIFSLNNSRFARGVHRYQAIISFMSHVTTADHGALPDRYTERRHLLLTQQSKSFRGVSLCACTRCAASISHLRSSVFRVSRSRLRWTGLAPRDIDLLLICVGRNFARAAYALHIGCISILFRLSELFMITSRKIKRGYRDG